MRPSPIESIASPWDEKRVDSFYNGSDMDKPLPMARPQISRQNTWPEAEGLQVVHPSHHPYPHSTLEYFGTRPKGSPSHAPEAFVRGYSDISAIEAHSGSGKPPYYHDIYRQRPRGNDYPAIYPPLAPEAKPVRVCGLSRRTFWILIAVLGIVIVAGAIAGGVGGALIHEQAANAASSTSTSSPDVSPDVNISGGGSSGSGSGSGLSPSSVSEPTVASTTLVNPTPLASSTEPATIVRDCPESNGTVYNVKLGSSNQEFVKNCNAAYSAVKSQGENFIVQTAGSLNDCIQLCAQFNINSNLSPAGEPQTCNSVCWRNTYGADNRAGTCFGYAVAILPGQTAALGNDTTCDSALWINQPSFTNQG